MPAAALLWVWFCVYFSLVGWMLSALHQLNCAGYLIATAIGLSAGTQGRLLSSAFYAIGDTTSPLFSGAVCG